MSENFSFFARHKKLFTIIVFFLICELGGIAIFYRQQQLVAGDVQVKTQIPKPKKTIQTAIKPTETKPISEEIKKNPTKAPIKPKPSIVKSNKMSGTTIKTAGGGKIVTISEGPVSNPQKIADSPASGNTPSTVNYLDDTGKNAALGNILKDYLGSKLKWKSEISSLHGIEVQDAGDTGWAGQYVGSYSLNDRGEVTSVIGWINLNVYYYKNDPNFTDYMKLVLSHEYGHHYSLYYKWTKWDLLAGTRFPDDYYTTRPLSKTTTAADYSLGWENCDAEIMAEDYSYIYSGYGYQAMSGKYGYPSVPATANWLAGGLVNGPNSTPVKDNPPTVSITSPTNNAELADTISFAATASDDIGVTKVSFYINNNLIFEDNSAPYQTSINTSGYENGNYTLKVIAYDKLQNAQSTISVIFNNQSPDTEKPVVTIIRPEGETYAWNDGTDLIIEASATDNNSVVKIEFYINDGSPTTVNGGYAQVRWPHSEGGAGTYILKVKAYDRAGNVGEKSIVINKS